MSSKEESISTSRRRALQQVLGLGAMVGLPVEHLRSEGESIGQQSNATPKDGPTRHAIPNASQMLRAFLERIAMSELEHRNTVISGIQNRGQIERRQIEIRKLLLQMVGGLPGERTALNVRYSGTLKRRGYRIEKIIYESLPRFYVTGNLYVPTVGTPPYPALLQPTGHSLSAKARASYQNLSLGLVKQGYVVLTYDPLGQGERRVFYDSRVEGSIVGDTVDEHEMVGIQSLLAGESIARYMIWDGMRSIDLLQSLAFVNPETIGVAGCSGGGTLTAYLAALDSRVQVAASLCYITDWEEQLKGTGPQDAEQQFPGQLKNGLDHGDLIIAFAPKPFLLCSTTEDFFPLDGARKTYNEARRIYEILDAGQKIYQFIAPGEHGMPRAAREAVYGWMNEWLKGASPGPTPEPDFETEYEPDLLCTPTGQVCTSLGGETVSSLNIHRFLSISPTRQPLKSPPDVESLKDKIRKEVLQVTSYEPPRSPVIIHWEENSCRNGLDMTRLMYEVCPGRSVPALLTIPNATRSRRKAVLFVDEQGVDAAAGPGGDIEQLAQLGYAVLALDPSGLAKSTPDWPGYSADWFGPGEKVAWLALMTGKSLVGIRMEDIIAGVEVLSQKGLLYDGGAVGFAKGLIGVGLLHAAVIDDRIDHLILEGNVVSFGSIATRPIHRRIFDVVLPGVLREYDMAYLVAAVAPRPVQMRNSRTPMGDISAALPLLSLEDPEKGYGYTVTSYRAMGASSRFHIGLRREDETVTSAYPELR